MGVGVLLKWQVYGTDFGPSLSTRPARNLKAGAARELRKENKNREDGLLPWGLQARRGQRSPLPCEALSTGWALHVVLLPLCHVGRWRPHSLLLMADSLRPRLQSLTDSLLSHRVFLYTFASTLAVSTTVFNALQSQSNFYSVGVYLSKSGASVLVAYTHVLSVYWNSNLLSSSDPRQL